MYEKVNPNLNFVEREKQVIDFWKKNEVFEKSVEKNEKGKEFSFYDGPPTANGKPHIGHILTRVMKDIIPRYKTMKGYHVLRKAGWDTHGLPVELEVEKLLGFDGKKDIEKFGIEPFIKECKNSVFKYQSEWEKMSDRVGYWVDMDNPYVTYNDTYIESVWWALKQIHDKGLIYKGHKIVPYCPRCGTALSSHEVAQGYKDVKEKSCVVKFKVENQDNTFILAWTTTPWTLPSNVAVCVNPKSEYAYVKVTETGEVLILAKELISKHLEEDTFTILKTVKGKDLEKTRYIPLFDFYKKEKLDCFYVTCDDYVTLSDGTGVVHIAPAFGEDDANVGRKYNLPFVQMVAEDGKFIEEAKTLSGIFCKDADKLIIKDLKERNLLFSEIMFEHSYPFCWRCDTPLLYYARSTWFIKMTEVRDRLLKHNDSVNWIPDNIKKGRMGNFLENVIDWGLSRERYWGTPLPLWVCEDCGHIHAIGSKEELKKLGGLSSDVELHKPYVDNVKIKCDKCGSKMTRTPEVIDCWFDSGAMPFAQWHYPFENKEVFEKTFPADFISEAVDQTRGWFYTLLAISTLLFDKAPFKNCIVLGHVNDKNGIKMSKHKGNVVDPWSVLDKQGADAVRWYFYTASSPWLPSRFYEDAVSEAQRKYLGTLWNTYSFYILYADIDKFDPTKYKLKDCKLSLMDKWILSNLNTLIDYVDKSLDDYKITESARAIQDFTDSLSNWYVRRCRERFWGSGMNEDKKSAFMTLYTVLETLTKLTAPYTPFMAENIYQNLVKSVDKKAPISVHLCDFPKADKKAIDLELEKGMQVVLTSANLGRACRNASNIKNRQPLSRLILAGNNLNSMSKELKEVLADELNVKEIEIAKDVSSFVDYDVKPQLKTLGPKYGKLIGKIREHLGANSSKIVDSVKAGTYSFELDSEKIELTADDLLINVKNKDGFTSESENNLVAVLDTTLTKDLISEGFMREIVSKVQTMRKDTGLEVVDHITLYISGDSEIKAVIDTLGERIKSDTLSDKLEFSDNKDSKEWDINGKAVKIAVKKI